LTSFADKPAFAVEVSDQHAAKAAWLIQIACKAVQRCGERAGLINRRGMLALRVYLRIRSNAQQVVAAT
jgi:hypothetical protein